MKRRLAAAILMSLCACPCLAQSASAAAFANGNAVAGEAAKDVIRKDVDEVNLVFSAYDRRHRFVKDLELGQIQLRDDRRPPERVTKFASETDLPLSAVLLIDLSDSIRGRFAFEKRAAIEFLQQTLRAESDEALIIGFNEQAEVAQDWTADKKLVAQAIEGLRSSGATALYDALGLACRKLSARKRRHERRAIIVISDGDDNKSRETLRAVTSQALEAEAAVYVLITAPRQRFVLTDLNQKARLLDSLTMATGGRMLDAHVERELAKAFGSIQQELRMQYVLSYKPAELRADGRYRTIELRSQGRSGVRFHYRRGYYSRSR